MQIMNKAAQRVWPPITAQRLGVLLLIVVGSLAMARVVEPLTALLVSVNRTYKLRDTGIKLVGRDAWGSPER